MLPPTPSAWAWRSFLVFFYEVTNSPEEAVSLANNPFDEAMADLHTLTIIMQWLQDSLRLGMAHNTKEKGVRLLRSPRTEPLLPPALPCSHSP